MHLLFLYTCALWCSIVGDLIIISEVGLALGFLCNVFTKSNIKKGAQKLLEFCSDVLKKHNENPNIGILDATKKVAKQKVSNTVKNFLQNPPAPMNTGISKIPITKPRKRKREGGLEKSLSKRFKSLGKLPSRNLL